MSGRPWHKREPELFQKLREEMVALFPALVLAEENDRIFFRGPYQIVDQGEPVDLPYQLEIELPPTYKEDLPLVREVGGRIPRKRDRHHVNEGDGTLCVCLPDKYLAEGGSPWLPIFLEGPVRSFLIGSGIVARGGKWPWGEWRHGTEGMLDFYRELTGASAPKALVSYLRMLASPQVKGHYECPCGSGARLRNCHRTQVLALRAKVPTHVAKKALAQLAAEVAK